MKWVMLQTRRRFLWSRVPWFGYGVLWRNSLGRPFYTMSWELVLALGRPCDWPDCAASANPFLSCPPGGSSIPMS